MKKLILAIAVFVITITFFNNASTEVLGQESASVYSESIDGYTQIILKQGDREELLTSGNFNHRQPAINEEYVVWVRDENGAGQIQRYHLPTKSILQLTFSSTNLNPSIDASGRVVWERWVGDTWQIFLFDSTSITQLTNNEVSLNPEIDSGKVIFSDKRGVSWASVLYDIDFSNFADIAVGAESKHPGLKGDIITLLGKEFPLGANDLLALELPPLEAVTTQNPVTESDILSEIESLSGLNTLDSEQ